MSKNNGGKLTVDNSNLTEKKIESEKIYTGPIFELYHDKIELPNGNGAVRDYVLHKGASCIVPVTDDGRVLVVRQFRYPMGEVLTEIPAGKRDSVDEDPLEAAKRELKEETGAAAREFISLGKFYPTCAYSTEVIYMYLALGLSFGENHPDFDEFLENASVPIDELVADIMAGRIKDGKTQAAVMKAYLMIKDRGSKN